MKLVVYFLTACPYYQERYLSLSSLFNLLSNVIICALPSRSQLDSTQNRANLLSTFSMRFENAVVIFKKFKQSSIIQLLLSQRLSAH
jgi:hypothetical protein